LEVATVALLRDDPTMSEQYHFSEDGLVDVSSKDIRVSWRVQGSWLEIDTNSDGTFQTRMHAIAIDVPNQRIVAESPMGKKSRWRYTWVRVVIKMIPPRPGYWQP
jgi:hypothetical protein